MGSCRTYHILSLPLLTKWRKDPHCPSPIVLLVVHVWRKTRTKTCPSLRTLMTRPYQLLKESSKALKRATTLYWQFGCWVFTRCVANQSKIWMTLPLADLVYLRVAYFKHSKRDNSKRGIFWLGNTYPRINSTCASSRSSTICTSGWPKHILGRFHHHSGSWQTSCLVYIVTDFVVQ